ncbi:hypothetical protein F5Y06DRAFT_299461 [Hypoxylon sp. FL0890]|nr:hypothetical protein F5Y06DRAFT_299461 [Hypoxylon sp. FL0890]
MDGEFQGHEGREHQFEEFIPDDEPNQENGRGAHWELLWQLIVHRNEDVQEAEPPDYPDEAWTLDEKHAPFPFNLEPTWYCATLLILILAIHSELDTKWLLHHGYRHYIIRVSSRTIFTVALSFSSTLLFEVIGNMFDLALEATESEVVRFIDFAFITLLRWRPVDDQEHPPWGDHDFGFYPGATSLFRLIRQIVGGIIVMLWYYPFIIIPWSSFIGSFFVSLAALVSTDLANWVSNLSPTFMLPTPGTGEISDSRTLVSEFGVPALFQVWAAAFLYLCVFLFMSRAETPIILKQGGQDQFSKLAFQLLRATAMHLLAYTAYQMVFLCFTATQLPLLLEMIPKPVIKDQLLIRVIRKLGVEFSPVAGALIIGAHSLVKSVCRLFVAFWWPLWVPYIVWLSIKTEASTWRNWIIYVSLLNQDMDVLNPDKRVTTRAIMTTLFSLKSSWPVRMRLSSVPGIN